MDNQRVNFKNEKQLQQLILEEKAKGIPDIEIGKIYGVTFRYIENLITKTHGLNISSLKVYKKIKTLYPKDFKEEKTTVWSFKQRGDWATHSSEYRGNWSPYIPRNVILKYSKPGDLVLDYFCGAGTTAVECKLLCRRCIALDINDKAIELAKRNIDFKIEPQQLDFIDKKSHLEIYEPKLIVGDARDLSFLKDNSVDLICAHPPYANIIHYTNAKVGDLSFFDIDDFLKEMLKVARESLRVLKPGRQCAILIGDTRRKKHVVPLGFKLINVYLNAGFKLRELIIKRQHNCKTTGFWYENSIRYNFLLLAHEYLPIFEKPINSYLNIREKSIKYSTVDAVSEKISFTKRLNKLETTTVWILPEKDFEEFLNKNVIERYSNRKDYSIINFISHTNRDKFTKINKKELQLLFIKSSLLTQNYSYFNIEDYLKRLKDNIIQKLPNISKGGFVVIQTQDLRINGYIEPLAKKIVDMLTIENLWLKEIIVVTKEEQSSNIQNLGNYLKITHQYLIVYEVIK